MNLLSHFSKPFSRFKTSARKGFTLIEIIIAMFLLNIMGIAIMETLAQIERVQVIAETDLAISNELKRQIQIVKGIPLEAATGKDSILSIIPEEDPPALYANSGGALRTDHSDTNPLVQDGNALDDSNGRLWGIMASTPVGQPPLKADVRWYRKTRPQDITGERSYIITVVVFIRRLGIPIERRGQVLRTLERGSRVE